jgi:hypothetical protein
VASKKRQSGPTTNALFFLNEKKDSRKADKATDEVSAAGATEKRQ